MALSDEVTLRYPEQVVKELTNPRSSSATTVDSTKLSQACTSVQAYFGLYAQAAYDSTKPVHVEVAVRGVVALLQSWGGSANGVARIKWDAWIEECRAVRDTRARARIQPQTTGVQVPSTEDANQKPPFDDSRFREIGTSLSAGPDPDLD